MNLVFFLIRMGYILFVKKIKNPNLTYQNFELRSGGIIVVCNVMGSNLVYPLSLPLSLTIYLDMTISLTLNLQKWYVRDFCIRVYRFIGVPYTIIRKQ